MALDFCGAASRTRRLRRASFSEKLARAEHDPKSGNRFSDKIMLKNWWKRAAAGPKT
jgi:hypothetical protein